MEPQVGDRVRYRVLITHAYTYATLVAHAHTDWWTVRFDTGYEHTGVLGCFWQWLTPEGNWQQV